MKVDVSTNVKLNEVFMASTLLKCSEHRKLEDRPCAVSCHGITMALGGYTHICMYSKFVYSIQGFVPVCV